MGQSNSNLNDNNNVGISEIDYDKIIIVNKTDSTSKNGALRLVLISDTHGQEKHLNIPPGDVLIHCGDFSDFYDSSSHAKDFNKWLGTLPHKHKLVISGNHDNCIEPNDKSRNQRILKNATYLQDSMVEIEGVKIYGSPWHEHRNSMLKWANNFGIQSKELQHKWKLIPDDTDILMTHFPPIGICTDNHIGCSILRKEVLERVKPKLHVFGHNHSYHGASLYSGDGDKIQFVNAASQIFASNLHKPIVVDYYRPSQIEKKEEI